jgi:phage shock protein PspC (stress-responsive transcriptional regulator)
MKRNISINISGIIFYIEEDGFDLLQPYLESIAKYFARFDDSREIIADIENRIAEIFQEKINPQKQVITLVDVQDLMTQMGSVEDFQAMADDDYQQPSASQANEATRKVKQLFRDTRRAVLGGVAAGIGYALRIDPIWIRLLFILSFLGFLLSPFSLVFSLGAYLLLWVMLKGRNDLEDEPDVKKFYRSPEDGILAGVAAGLSKYWNVDETLVRILFIISSVFGGFGIAIYIILWAFTPEAKTITERMQMEGEPITLENIAEAIKRGLKMEPEAEEGFWLKLFLAPFRLLALILEQISPGMRRVLRFGVELGRVLGALVILLISGTLFFALGTVILFFLGWLPKENVRVDEIPLDMLYASIPNFSSLATSGGITLLLLAVGLGILGLNLLFKTRLVSATYLWALFGFLLFSVSATAVLGFIVKQEFNYQGEYQKQLSFASPQGTTLLLKVREAGQPRFSGTSLQLKGYQGTNLQLVQVYSAAGRDAEDALNHAHEMSYQVSQQDSVLVFDRNFSFAPKALYRDQRLRMTLYIPYEMPFRMEENLAEILRDTLYKFGYRRRDMKDNLWKFNTQGELVCLTCPPDERRERRREREKEWKKHK